MFSDPNRDKFCSVLYECMYRKSQNAIFANLDNKRGK